MSRAFVIVDIPAQETLIGQLTMDTPGCTIDLIGRPNVHAGEHNYQLHYVVRGVAAGAKQAIEPQLSKVYTKFETLAYDEAEGTWIVECEVPVANIRSPGLRFVAGLFGLAPMPWILFSDGVGQARILPGREESIAHVAELLDARLQSAGIDARPRVEMGDWLEQFQERVAAAGWDA